MEAAVKKYLKDLAKKHYFQNYPPNTHYFAITTKLRYFRRGFHNWRVEAGTYFIIYNNTLVETPDGRFIDHYDYLKAEKDGYVTRIPNTDWQA